MSQWIQCGRVQLVCGYVSDPICLVWVGVLRVEIVKKKCEITIQGFQAPLCKPNYSSFLTTYKLNHTKCERI